MSDVELIEFKKYKDEALISVNVVIGAEEALELEDVWFNQVKSCQAPLIGTYKNGFTVFIPWMLKEESDTL